VEVGLASFFTNRSFFGYRSSDIVYAHIQLVSHSLFSSLENDEWKEEQKMDQPHADWVRDVAWAPNIGIPADLIASCSQV
jgi:hypothetical protein